jgi:hypothetical protein
MKKIFKIFHPSLFAAYPLIFIFSNNLSEINIKDLFIYLFISIVGSIFLLLILLLTFKSYEKASILTSIYLLLFFSYGYIYDLILGIVILNIKIGRASFLLSFYLLIIIYSFFYIFKTKRNLKIINIFFNIVSLVLILFPLIKITTYEYRQRYISSQEQASNVQIQKIENTDKLNKPDIYYIILDAYANNETLKELYKYDNKDFINYLKNKGFYIADKSASNFAVTHISLSSSLNMEYVNYLEDEVKNKDENYNPTKILIENNKVSQYLKSIGYEYINFRSYWGGSSYNKYADYNFQGGRFGELFMVLFNTTILRASVLYPPIYKIVLGDYRYTTLYDFEKLSEMPDFNTGNPKFIFVHFLIPHPPFIFGPNGENVENVELKMKPVAGWNDEQKKMYLNQIIFVNNKMKEVIDKILAKSKDKPIIILQADHGPWSTALEDRANNLLYKERTKIFNAYYLPNGGEKKLYNYITPVNTFRLILSYYFNANFPLLKDKIYFSDSTIPGKKTPYQFVDVTDIIFGK